MLDIHYDARTLGDVLDAIVMTSDSEVRAVAGSAIALRAVGSAGTGTKTISQLAERAAGSILNDRGPTTDLAEEDPDPNSPQAPRSFMEALPALVKSVEDLMVTANPPGARDQLMTWALRVAAPLVVAAPYIGPDKLYDAFTAWALAIVVLMIVELRKNE